MSISVSCIVHTANMHGLICAGLVFFWQKFPLLLKTDWAPRMVMDLHRTSLETHHPPEEPLKWSDSGGMLLLVCSSFPYHQPGHKWEVIVWFRRAVAGFAKCKKREQGVFSTSWQLPGTGAAVGGTARESCSWLQQSWRFSPRCLDRSQAIKNTVSYRVRVYTYTAKPSQ